MRVSVRVRVRVLRSKGDAEVTNSSRGCFGAMIGTACAKACRFGEAAGKGTSSCEHRVEIFQGAHTGRLAGARDTGTG